MKFWSEYWFLSNSSNSPMQLEIDGKIYQFQNAEAAFLACRSPKRAAEFQGLTAREAKELNKKMKSGRKTLPNDVRDDWDQVKLDEMRRVLKAKFSERTLQNKLLAITEPITMDIDYQDLFWGLVNGRGQNQMGKALTDVRDAILEEKGISTKKTKKGKIYKVQHGGAIAFDTETTGTSSKYDDIIQITITAENGATLLDTYVKPQNCTKWEGAMAVNKITPEMLKDAPDPSEVAKAVKYIFDGADTIIGYNVGFDTKMVAARFGYDFKDKTVIDLLPIYQNQLVGTHDAKLKRDEYFKTKKYELKETKGMLIKDAEKYIKENDEYYQQLDRIVHMPCKLINAIENCLPEYSLWFKANAHDATADTRMTMELAKYLKEKGFIDFEKSNMILPSDGIMCQLVDSSGDISEGFNKRLCDTMPGLADEIIDTVNSNFGKELYGIYNIFGNDKFKIATVYNNVKDLDVPTFCKCLQEIATKYPKYRIHIPVIWKENQDELEIVDGIGNNGHNLKFITQNVLDLNLSNIYWFNTQIGQSIPYNTKSISEGLKISDNYNINNDEELDIKSSDTFEIEEIEEGIEL